MEKDLMKISKMLAYLLRHDPRGMKMDQEGWVSIGELLPLIKTDKDTLDMIVFSDDKKRYSYRYFDGELKIRANQGHSIDFVNIKFSEIVPPTFLFHGTSPKFIDSIMINGLDKMTRRYVHLSTNKIGAFEVGQRHAKTLRPIVLKIESSKMYEDGYKFYLSENKVWLTDFVPAKYISITNIKHKNTL